MNKIALSIVLILLSLCGACGGDPSGESTNITLYNLSEHPIELQQFSDGEYVSSTFINHNKNEEYHLQKDLGGIGSYLPPFDVYIDSIQIIYGEIASIWHSRADNQVVSKSLLLESSYEGGKVKDGLYEFTYTFTEDDFQEAVDFGD